MRSSRHNAAAARDIVRRDPGDEIWNVEPGGAPGPARPDAVASVVGEQEFEGGLARGTDLLRIGDDVHPFGGWHGAGGPETGPALDLDRAQETGGRRLEALDKTECRDGDAQLPRRLQDGLAWLDLDEAAVNSEGEGLTGKRDTRDKKDVRD